MQYANQGASTTSEAKGSQMTCAQCCANCMQISRLAKKSKLLGLPLVSSLPCQKRQYSMLAKKYFLRANGPHSSFGCGGTFLWSNVHHLPPTWCTNLFWQRPTPTSSVLPNAGQNVCPMYMMPVQCNLTLCVVVSCHVAHGSIWRGPKGSRKGQGGYFTDPDQ